MMAFANDTQERRSTFSEQSLKSSVGLETLDQSKCSVVEPWKWKCLEAAGAGIRGKKTTPSFRRGSTPAANQD